MIAHTLSVQDALQSAPEANQLLHGRLALNSRNSSKPPASNGYAKPKPKSLRGKSGKKSGGQPAYPGVTLEPVQVPDITKIHQPSICPCGCGSDLSALPVIEYVPPAKY